MARRNKGVAFLLIGCILLLVAGGWWVYNLAEDHGAGQQAAQILSKFDEQSAEVSDNEALITVDGEAFCGKVMIEKLGVALPVYDEWDYTRLKTAPCRYMGGVDTGDMIIAAHNYKSHFGTLDKLAIGDEITFIDTYGTAHTYAVRELALLDGTAVSDMQAGGWDFTLFTCTKSGEQRVTVRCEKIA